MAPATASNPRATGGRPDRRQPCACRVDASHQALKCLPRRRVRGDAQFALKDRRAVVVGAHRTGAIAHVGLQLHQGAVADLFQRLQLDPAAGDIHRSSQVTRSRSRLSTITIPASADS